MSLTRFLIPILASLVAIFCGLRLMRPEPHPGGRVFRVQDIGRELKETCTYVDDLKGCARKATFWSLELGLGLIMVIPFVIVQRLSSTNQADCCSSPVHLLSIVPSGCPIWTSTTLPQLVQVTLQRTTRAPRR